MAYHGHFSPSILARTRLVGLIVMVSLGASGRAAAVAEDNPEPLQCWWRTTVSAIRVGEPFGLILT